MTPHVPDNVSGWLAELSLVTLIDDMLPPRDPHDGDDEDEDEDEDEEDGGDEDEDEDEDEEEEPAVIREPDE